MDVMDALRRTLSVGDRIQSTIPVRKKKYEDKSNRHNLRPEMGVAEIA